MKKLDAFMKVFADAGGEKAILSNRDIAHLVVTGRTILSSREVEGLEVTTEEIPSGISAKVGIAEGIRIVNPVHLCFGILHKKGTQRIRMDVRLERGSAAHFIAHCLFPDAEKVRHIMDAVVDIGSGAELRYSEAHYHGPYGGIEVIPKALVRIGERGRYIADFTLTTGRVGKLRIDYTVEAGKNAVAELTARVFGHGNDDIRIMEKILLAGEDSRGLIKTRVALENDSSAEVTGITEGNAAGARGHVDCLEIVKDNAVAKAIPIVNVTNPLAKVTHEAAIGSVDKKQLETLMAHGLTPEEAVDIIVRGILK
jgi:Fe-S cluster assembly scaffold protein SufB